MAICAFNLRFMAYYSFIHFTYSFTEPLTEDYCGVEPVTHPPDVIETRPPPVVDEDKLRQIYQRTDSAILGGKIGVHILQVVADKHFEICAKTHSHLSLNIIF
jgi:hypothetical protein